MHTFGLWFAIIPYQSIALVSIFISSKLFAFLQSLIHSTQVRAEACNAFVMQPSTWYGSGAWPDSQDLRSQNSVEPPRIVIWGSLSENSWATSLSFTYINLVIFPKILENSLKKRFLKPSNTVEKESNLSFILRLFCYIVRIWICLSLRHFCWNNLKGTSGPETHSFSVPKWRYLKSPDFH